MHARSSTRFRRNTRPSRASERQRRPRQQHSWRRLRVELAAQDRGFTVHAVPGEVATAQMARMLQGREGQAAVEDAEVVEDRKVSVAQAESQLKSRLAQQGR